MTRLGRALLHGSVAVVATRALAQGDATSMVFGPWSAVFSGVDVVTMLTIGVVSFWLTRSFAVSEAKAIFIPTGLGLLYGVIEALTRLEQGGGLAVAAQVIFQGVMVNGAASTLVGRLTAFLMARWWPSPADRFRQAVDDTAKAIQRGEQPPPPGVVVKVRSPTAPPAPDKLEPPG